MEIAEEENTHAGADAITPYIPEELIQDILHRTLTKPLFRFKCVSKSWREWISIPPPIIAGFFSSNHLEQVCFHGFQTEVDLSLAIDVKLSFLQRPIFVVASHNGLLLCAQKPNSGWYLNPYRVHYFVCNPLTKQWVALPEPHYDHYVKSSVLCCFHREEEDSNPSKLEFMVVSFIKYYGNNTMEIEIFSSETGLWKKKYSNISHTTGNAVVLNGCIYLWSFSSQSMVVYDLKKESVGLIVFPGYQEDGKRSGLLGVSAGSLCYALTDSTYFSVWVFGDGDAWLLKHRIAYGNLIRRFTHARTFSMFKPLVFHPLIDHLVIVGLDCVGVGMYRMDTQMLEVIHDFIPKSCFGIIPYSLVKWLPCIPQFSGEPSKMITEEEEEEIKKKKMQKRKRKWVVSRVEKEMEKKKMNWAFWVSKKVEIVKEEERECEQGDGVGKEEGDFCSLDKQRGMEDVLIQVDE